MAILVTGAAGFIGYHLSRTLLARGDEVVGVDNLNDYYDPSLKRARLKTLEGTRGFRFIAMDIADESAMEKLRSEDIGTIIHLAAQAGVRYSIDNPRAYAHANLTGHTEVLELARHKEVKRLVYASSSSVYGANTKVPFAEDDRTDSPVSFYGATKKANELLSESYSRLYGLSQAGLRFFTVYGPFGRPDMAYMIFARKILQGQPIDVFGEGEMGRDFTYVDDIVQGIMGAHDRRESSGGHRVYNLGNDQPERLATLIDTIEELLGKKAERRMLPMQMGDVRETWADITRARSEIGYDPKTSLKEGLAKFIDWYKDHQPS